MESFISTLVALFALLLSVSITLAAAFDLCSRILQNAGHRRASRETLNRRGMKKARCPVRS